MFSNKITFILVSLLISFTQNFAMNIDSLKQESSKDNKYAKAVLGEIYRRGEWGVKKDYKKALSLFLESKDHPLSIYSMAVMYEKGYEVEKDSAKAKQLYQKFFNSIEEELIKELPEVQINIGHCFKNGMGVPKDDNKAIEWYTKAAEQKNPAAQYLIGRHYYNGTKDYYSGTIVGIDLHKAVEWYTKAAKKGYTEAQVSLGYCFYAGKGVSVNFFKAAEWWNKAAVQGNATAQANLGVCYESGNGVIKNIDEAVEWYTKASEQGEVNAQNSLGQCFEFGKGVEKDVNKAFNLYTKAAKQGDAKGQTNVANCYFYGVGVIKDYNKALDFFTKAAKQEYVVAQRNLAVCYELGKGTTKDLSNAVKWYRKAAEQGDAHSQAKLGYYYHIGKGVARDLNTAADWLMKAAKQGNAEAQKNLGVCYENGYGITKSLSKAKEWYTKSAEQGYIQAKNELLRIQFRNAKNEGTLIALEEFKNSCNNSPYCDSVEILLKGFENYTASNSDNKISNSQTFDSNFTNVILSSDTIKSVTNEISRWSLLASINSEPIGTKVYFYESESKKTFLGKTPLKVELYCKIVGGQIGKRGEAVQSFCLPARNHSRTFAWYFLLEHNGIEKFTNVVYGNVENLKLSYILMKGTLKTPYQIPDNFVKPEKDLVANRMVEFN